MMGLTRFDLALLAAAGSAGMLIAAFYFQHVGGLEPCKLCIWQRWPHVVAVPMLGLWLVSRPAGAGLGAVAMATNAGLGVYHTGIQFKLWPGPASCTSDGGTDGLSAAQLLSGEAAKPVVMCDEITWTLMGLPMPAWSALASAGLAVIWLASLTLPEQD